MNIKQLLAASLLTAAIANTNASAQKRDTTVLIKIDQYLALVGDPAKQPIYDVRTKEEFDNTHVSNAQLITTDTELQDAIGKGQKDAVVLLYSIANGRSVNLASKLRAQGVKNIYALDGGIAAWVSKGLPYTSNHTETANISSFQKALQTDSLVLVDIGSRYCGPCKKVSHIIDSFSTTHPNLKIVKLDMDNDTKLIAALQIAPALPTVVAYKAGHIVWHNTRNEDWATLPQTLTQLATRKEEISIR